MCHFSWQVSNFRHKFRIWRVLNPFSTLGISLEIIFYSTVALWTLKVMEVVPDDHMLLFFCIDYTIWPGWNHRGVYILSRKKVLETKIRRKLSPAAHRRMRMDYHRWGKGEGFENVHCFWVIHQLGTFFAY